MTYANAALCTKLQLSRCGCAGQEKEQELKYRKEIYNYRARIYDAKLRKFLSPDKAKQQVGTYTYVANNPVSLVDRDGEKLVFFDQASLEYYKAFKERRLTMPNSVLYIKDLNINFFETLEKMEDFTITFRYNPSGNNFFSSTANTIELNGLSRISSYNGHVSFQSREVIAEHEFWHAVDFNIMHKHDLLSYKASFIDYTLSTTHPLFAFSNNREHEAIKTVEIPFMVAMNSEYKKSSNYIFQRPDRTHMSSSFSYKFNPANFDTFFPAIGQEFTYIAGISAEKMLLKNSSVTNKLILKKFLVSNKNGIHLDLINLATHEKHSVTVHGDPQIKGHEKWYSPDDFDKYSLENIQSENLLTDDWLPEFNNLSDEALETLGDPRPHDDRDDYGNNTYECY